MKVQIDAIRIDGGTQCRVVIDQPTVYQYVEAMKEGDEFPLIETVFDGSTHWLTDGFHRYHAMKLIGIKQVDVKHTQGTQRDAQIAALFANSKHGKPLTNEDKRNKVKMALEIDGFDEKSDREIATLCGVSAPFVASIRNPKVKEKQDKNREKSIKAKVEKDQECNPITPTDFVREPEEGCDPDDEEIRVSEMALQADQDAMYKLLESDDALKTAYDEIKRLNLVKAGLEARIAGLMNEKNEAIKMVKSLQSQLDKRKK